MSQISDEIFIPSDSERITHSWFERTFSPLDDGAQRAGILVLIISALGTGILTLHHFFNCIGIYIGILVLLIVGIGFIFSSDILI